MTDLERWLHTQHKTGGNFAPLYAEAVKLNSKRPANIKSEYGFKVWFEENLADEHRILLKGAYKLFQEEHAVGSNPQGETPVELTSYSTAELFAAQEQKIEWLVWPFAAVGLSSILDALPKLGKTRFILEGIRASRNNQPFLGWATKPMRVIYVSEQSAASLAMQAREVGFTGKEPIEELRWITREQWCWHLYTEFLARLEERYLEGQNYNCLIMDTWHTIARLENENDAAEVNRCGNLTLDLAARRKLALAISRHDRKSGGEVGLSGRSSIQLSGLVDVILHLLRLPGQAGPTQRRLELVGRVPQLPAEQIIELSEKGYVNHGVVKGGVETKKMSDVILERVPTYKEAALPIMEILKGSGLQRTQPVARCGEQVVKGRTVTEPESEEGEAIRDCVIGRKSWC